mgnify:CR=1 FL=1
MASNRAFAEATTGIAFVLTLTKRQCNTLLRLREHEAKHGKPEYHKRHGPQDGVLDKQSPGYIGVLQGDQLAPLRDRGLVSWWHNRAGQAEGFAGLTKAGELAAELLVEAGLTIEATNTLSVIKRMSRAA